MKAIIILSKAKYRYLLSLALLFGAFISVKAQMKEPYEWIGYEKVMGVQNGLMHYDYDVKAMSSSAPANVFWPEDKISFTFQLQNNTGEYMDVDARAEVIHYGARGIPNDIWLPEMFKMEEVETLPLKVRIALNLEDMPLFSI